jgi:hypothetical protein
MFGHKWEYAPTHPFLRNGHPDEPKYSYGVCERCKNMKLPPMPVYIKDTNIIHHYMPENEEGIPM